MGKLVLSFALPDDKEEALTAMHAGGYRAALNTLDNWLRGLHKYGDSDTVLIEEVRAKLRDALDELPL